MTAHRWNGRRLALAVSVGLIALSVTGLALAMPDPGNSGGTGPGGMGAPVGTPLLSTGPAVGAPSPRTGPAPADALLPPPEPVALRAADVNRWVAERLAPPEGHGAADGPTQVTNVWAAIDACVAADMKGDPEDERDDTWAASIAVSIDGVITYTKGYGERDRDAGGEVDADTMFRIGSTTKMMTAAAILQLREQGLVDLEEPLSTYLPEYRLGHPWSADDLDLDLLLSHQSGLLDQYFVNEESTPLMDWVQATGSYSLPLYAPPGSFWNYANPNFSLAGAVVERLGGMPYNQYMAEKVWDPSGMPLTTIDPTEVISTGNYATGYRDGVPMTPLDFTVPMIAPAGSAFSTPSELVRWALSLQSDGDGVLSSESKQLMQQRRVSLGYLPWMDYGYGVMVTDWRDAVDPDTRVVVYDHGGNIHGGSSQLYWVPERGVVVSILANTIRSLDNAAACAVRALAGIEPIPADETKTQPEEWDAFAGTYSMLDVLLWPWTGSVRRVSDTLRLDFPDVYGSGMLMGDDIPFYYAYADLFVPLARSMIVPSGVDMAFMRDAADPTRIRYMRNRNLVGQRVGQFPDRVSIVGEACATLDITSELDMPVLDIHTSGLVTTTRLVSVPLSADSPTSLDTVSIKVPCPVGPGGADMVAVVAHTAPEDAAGLFLVRDLDGDGAIDPASGEIVAQGLNDYGTSLLYLPDGLEPGDYELWVHGSVVLGEDSVVHVELTTMQGDNLRLENRPRGLADGAKWRMEVCADDVGAMQEARTGMIEFRYDSPPRLFRVMVDWQPESAPPGSMPIYLPVGKSGR